MGEEREISRPGGWGWGAVGRNYEKCKIKNEIAAVAALLRNDGINGGRGLILSGLRLLAPLIYPRSGKHKINHQR